jgi:hypothetical protein
MFTALNVCVVTLPAVLFDVSGSSGDERERL